MKNADTAYVAFLRGINVGGNKKVPMADLKKGLEKAGFKNVKTLLASGNVLLESSEKNTEALVKKIEKVIEDRFGFTSSVIVRTMGEIEKLMKADPFKGIVVTPETRLYVTFLKEKPTRSTGSGRESALKIPYVSPDKSFRILSKSSGEIFSVMTVIPGKGTPEAMNILEKEFGKNITTRNWNTVKKLLLP